MALDVHDKLKLDYERCFDNYKWLADVRFKLLGLVPTATAAITILVRGKEASKSPAEFDAILATFGFFVTLGVAFYDLRNSALYDATIHRLRAIERELRLANYKDAGDTGGLFSERPTRQRLFGVITFWHDRALALVYGASLGLWANLATSSISLAVLVALVFMLEFARLERARSK